MQLRKDPREPRAQRENDSTYICLGAILLAEIHEHEGYGAESAPVSGSERMGLELCLAVLQCAQEALQCVLRPVGRRPAGARVWDRMWYAPVIAPFQCECPRWM